MRGTSNISVLAFAWLFPRNCIIGTGVLPVRQAECRLVLVVSTYVVVRVGPYYSLTPAYSYDMPSGLEEHKEPLLEAKSL